MPALPRVGDPFGRYRIDTQIGRGGMGIVYGATDTSLGRTVALKVVSADLGGSEEFLRRFEREASVLARLDSPHVIAIYDYGSHDDCPYIATQYVGGGDLGVLLHDRGPMTPAAALRVCAQVADALDDAHRVGVVHRDVKPTNVLLRDRDADELHAYLCDFGIARTATDGLTAPGSVAGTWSYLAPECGRGAPATPSSDVYAVGCLLWATLTGLPPYLGTDVQIAVAHQRAEIRQLPGTSPVVRAINEVLAHSMAKTAADRYPDADRMRTALLAAATAPGVHDPLPPVPAGDPGTLEISAFTPPPGRSPLPGPPPGSNPPGSTPPGVMHQGSTPPAATVSGTWPPPPPVRRRRGVVVATVAALVLGVGGLTAAVVLSPDDPAPSAGDPTGDPSTGEPTDGPTDGPTELAGAQEPAMGDLDGDGRGDLSVDFDARDPEATLSTTWTSDGSTFTETGTDELAPFGEGDGVWRLTGHLDDDATTDVLTFRQPSGDDPVTVSGELSGGSTIDATLPGGARPVATFDALDDVDGDGIDDLMSLQITGSPRAIVLSTWAFDGEDFAAAEERLRLTSDVQNTWVRAGDVDGDDVADLVTHVVETQYDDDFRYPGVLELRLGDGEGGYAEPITTTTSSGSDRLDLLTGDFDGDGIDQVLITEEELGFVVLSTYDLEDGTITSTPTVGSIRNANIDPIGPTLTVTDVTGDGRDDVISVGLVRPGGTARVLVAVADDTGGFTSRRWLAWDQVFAEQDGDGRLEVLDGARW